MGLAQLLKPRSKNLIDELPYRELHSGIMHLHNGQFEGGIEIAVPNVAFVRNVSDLTQAFRQALGVMPGNSRMRFSLETAPADRDFLEGYKARLTATEPGIRQLIMERIKALEKAWAAGEVRQWRVYCSVRQGNKRRGTFNITLEERQDRERRVKEVNDRLIEAFATINFPAKPMTTQEVFALCHRYLNPGQVLSEPERYRTSHRHYPTAAIKKIKGCAPPTLRTRLGKSVIGNHGLDRISVGNQYVKMFALTTLPTADTVPGMLSAAEASGRHFMVTLDVVTEHADKTMRMITNRAKQYESSAETPDYYVDPETRVLNRETRDALEHVHSSGDSFHECSMLLTLFDSDAEELDKRVEKTTSSLNKIPGAPFTQLTHGLTKPFLDAAPFSGFEHDQKVSLSTSNIVHLFPLSGPWRGSEKPVAIYRNRYSGLTFIDPFDRSADNYNALIIGRSGAGKTFKAQYLLSEFLADASTQVVIIDRGSGYKPLVDAAEGVVIPIAVGGSTSINPFDLPPGMKKPTDEEKTLILGIIRAMIPGGGGAQQELEDAIMTSALTQTYEFSYRRRGTKEIFETPTLSSFVRKLEQINEINDKHMESSHQEIAHGLAMRLQQWTGDSALGKFVDRQTNIPLAQSRLVYYDTEGVRHHPQLKTVGTVLINNLVFQRAKRTTGQETLILLDEGWAFVKDSAEGQAFVDEMFRRLRSTGSGIILATQSYAEVQDLPGIATNTSTIFSLKPDAQERERLRVALDIPENALKVAAMTTSQIGEFSQAFCIQKRDDTFVGNIIEVRPTKADYWTFTTNHVDKAKRDAAVEKHGSLERAMEDLVA